MRDFLDSVILLRGAFLGVSGVVCLVVVFEWGYGRVEHRAVTVFGLFGRVVCIRYYSYGVV